MGFQSDPSCRQVQKTQATRHLFAIAGGHAPPPLEPTEAPFSSVARQVPFRVAGRGFVCRLRAAMTASTSCGARPARKASPSLARSALRQDRGVSVQASPKARAWMRLERGPRHAQAQGTALSIRQGGDRGTEAAPAAARSGLRLFFAGGAPVRAPDRAVPPHGGPAGAAIRPGRLAAIDRVPLPVRGRPRTPGRALPAQRCHEETATRFITHAYNIT